MAFSYTEISNYYAHYLTELDICKTKKEAKEMLLEALAYNVVREAIIEQIQFLQENKEEEE